MDLYKYKNGERRQYILRIEDSTMIYSVAASVDHIDPDPNYAKCAISKRNLHPEEKIWKLKNKANFEIFSFIQNNIFFHPNDEYHLDGTTINEISS